MSGVSSRLQNTVENRLKNVPDAQTILNSISSAASSVNTISAQNVRIQSPLRGGDVHRRIISIDSRFRSNPDTSTTSDFSINLSTPIKNAVRIRVVSVELPNNYHFFNTHRRNVTMAVEYGTGYSSRVLITIDSGNYIASDMENEINTKLVEASINWLTVSWDNVKGFFCFTGTQDFRLDMTPETFDRRFDYGLGFFLGFNRSVKMAAYDGTKYYTTCSDFYANFAGDNYLLLSINGLNCIQHQTNDGVYDILGKIILREPKNYMIYDDYASQHAKECIFIAPTNFDKLDIRILDPFAQSVDFKNANISISLEVVEVVNIAIFNVIRDGMLSSF